MADIISKEEQPLLGRTLVQAKASFEGPTPARTTIRKEVAKALGEKEEHVIIKTINTGYGAQSALIEAAIYKKIEDAQAIEHKSLMGKHEKKEEPKEEAPEEEAPAKEAENASEQEKSD